MRRGLPRIFAVAPSGNGGAALTIAASRAGALGLLDLEGASPEAALAAATGAAAWGDEIGVRVECEIILAPWLAALPVSIRAVCCIAAPDAEWERVVGMIRATGRLALFEVTARDEAMKAKGAGADGVILAGHEAGGRCGDESSFILLQSVLADGGPPAWVRGGIGPDAAAGCVAMGASGVVLDGALLLAKESPLDEPTRAAIARLDGTETEVILREDGATLRAHAAHRPRTTSTRETPSGTVGWGSGGLWPIGQDAAFAASLARRHVTAGGIIGAVETAIDRGIELARTHRPLASGSPLAQSHGTAYPIVQGPMTRVSDTAAFASAVAEGGGLPFLALAMLRGAEVRTLLADARDRLAERAWGVGVLGFVTPELSREQMEAIREARPPFALIAGGRPDQARELEDVGIRTYLHAPSPGLLDQYLKAGARRFVLEGRECGGHVGPRSSLVLWEQAVAVLQAFVEAGNPTDDLHVLFAGGIHDARSSAGVAAIAAPLAAKGVKVGVLIGTAYLFTEEAVATGAIVPKFQAEAIRCRKTVLLETGPGHEVRVGPSPFADAFADHRRKLLAEGRSHEEIREELERMNAGRLRVATKGLDRSDSALVPVGERDQYERGVYMLGQVAALRVRVTTIADLHGEISEGGDALLGEREIEKTPAPAPNPADIAIVGLSAILPGAADVRTFWENTLHGRDAIVEVPPDRWDHRPYYDADQKSPDKIVSKWGGFVPDVPFDPLRYGMPPTSLTSIEPVQLLVLEAVRKALDDAGYTDRPFPRERTAVVLGMGGGAAQLAMGYAFRSYLPMLESIAPEAGKAAREAAAPFLPEWTEDSFPGFLLNVAAGRVANRFDLGGSNFTVDAACGSSLAATNLAVRELTTGAADMVILGGADTVQNPLTYLAFSKTHAFSPRGRCRPFDASADGIVISEGVGVVILKRLADAERDGDRIYAVIKGMGSSSDGRDRGLTAPNIDGQTRALRRAYDASGIDPATLGYVEAHGTGTAVGDVVEVNALGRLLRDAGAAPSACAVGSVKSMIGHTKCAAGIAGLINASLALHHKVLPPTIGVETVNPKADLADGPLRVSAKPRPWFHTDPGRPRRAGVSAFGFGGTNFHAVLEGYDRGTVAPQAPSREWPAELLLWREETAAEVAGMVGRLARSIDDGAKPNLRDLARSLAERFDPDATSRPTLAIVAQSIDDLRPKLTTALKAIAAGQASISDASGVEYAERPEFAGAKPAILFPGQGSQSLEMLGDLAFTFPEVRESFEAFDAALLDVGRDPITPKVFPPTTLDDAGRERARHALMATDVAQPAIGAASVGMLRLLRNLGVEPGAVAGHSYGELVALHAAGCFSVDALAVLSHVRGTLMRDAAGGSPGTMAAIVAGPDRVGGLIEPSDGVVVANLNGPKQTVISGPRDSVVRVVDRARAQGLRVVDLPVACAFHSPAVAGASGALAGRARSLLSNAPDRPVFANVDAAPHPADPAAIAERLGQQLASPVRFAEMVAAMHDEGARVFIEVGPGAVLAPMVRAILDGRPHLSIATDSPSRPGIPTLLRTLAKLAVAGIAVRPGRLTAGRDAKRIDPERPPVGDGLPALPASTWLVNGSRARPIGGPEPKRLGQALDPKTSTPSRNGRHHHPTTNGPHVTGLAKPMNNHRLDEHASSRNGHAEHLPRLESLGPARNGHAVAEPTPRLAPGRNGHVAPRPTPVPGASGVMEAFQETMRAFLETQRATMLAYLGHPAADAMPAAVPPAQPRWSDDGDAAIYTNGHGKGAPRPPRGDLLTPDATNGHAPAPPHTPPPAPTRAEAPPDAPSEPVTGREAVARRLVEIVRDRTGYPAEMLKLDLDLEADLGVDSIKRVEILGTLRETVAGLESSADSSLMDDLARARTLGAIADRVAATLEACQPARTTPAAPERTQLAPEAADRSASPVSRMTLEAVEAPLSARRQGLMPGGRIVVTDDGRGVARALDEALRSEGHAVAILDRASVELSSPSSVEAAIDRIRSDGPISGIVHALPLGGAEVPGLDPRDWNERVGIEVKGLFHLARAASPDLDVAARGGGACLIAATAMGGSFASTGEVPDGFFPGQGGVAGLVKTLARELPEVRARVVDLDPTGPCEGLASRLASEALADDGWPEVGYRGGRRVRLRAGASPLDRSASEFSLAPGEPVLITGGARGITAAVAEELARRWKPRLLLVGSSPLPADSEDQATRGIVSQSELKAALHGRLRRSGKAVDAAGLEQAYRTLLNERQIRTTLRSLREAGSEVEYARADVRDAEGLSKALEEWRRRFGDPVGLIHGAGVIHDKLLRDKTPESFDRVLGTKLDGALNLARLVRPEPLRFAAFFSSIAGRFGNKGQSDYAAANDALNKLAVWLDRRMSGRVVSVNWGPWSGVGMVSDLEGHLGRRGLGMIPPEVGRAAMADELMYGRKGEVEVVIAGELGSLDEPLVGPSGDAR